MPNLALSQAVFSRRDHEDPVAVVRSPDFGDAWAPEAFDIIRGFGDRVDGMRCPLAVFAQPIGANHVAVVRVKDDVEVAGLWFHFLVVESKAYEAWIRDPFLLAEKVSPTWDATGPLPTIQIPQEAFEPRTFAQVQAVLKRIKASALREGEDPESPDFERTAENSESPALLGGAQILVDGGKLVFERPQGDLRLVSGLWLLLPEATRLRLWPTSFAFSQDLGFDVLVVPRLDELILENYTTEEQAADYPDGTYESALQRAVEHGTQQDLDGVFRRRDSHHTIRLAILLLVLVSGLVLLSRWLDFVVPPVSPVQREKAAAAAGIVAVGEPWTALGMLVHGNAVWSAEEKKRDAK
ncbi:MAG: hypothetical protein HYX68_28480 [Planctomycetes bacterium]|nr:hypothetical protein [Planctomycetota bacterium]